jgi:vesicle-fusing ATPase
MRSNNIKKGVNDKKNLENCLLKFNYTTKINIIKNDNCNIKLITSSLLKNGSNLNMSIDEIKNIKTKLIDNGLSGMDIQIDKIIKEILLPRSNFINDTFKRIIKLPKGILLYGPPGTGKTSLARNIAKIIGIPNDRIKMLNAPEIFSKWLGESEENIRKLFKDAKEDKNNLHLVIIDEIDSILKSRSITSCDTNKSDIVNQFLGEMDGLDSVNNIIIIGITNKIDMLDSAILRPGRFGCKIFCGLPNDQERLNIIKLYHNRIVDSVNFNEIDFDKLVKITNGFSGAQIEDIYVKIVELIIESQFNGNDIVITNEIINNIVIMIE